MASARITNLILVFKVSESDLVFKMSKKVTASQGNLVKKIHQLTTFLELLLRAKQTPR